MMKESTYSARELIELQNGHEPSELEQVLIHEYNHLRRRYKIAVTVIGLLVAIIVFLYILH